MRGWFLFLALLLGSCCKLPAQPGSSITMGDYSELRNGMSYHQACGKLHGSGVEMSSSKIGPYETTMYKWSCSPGVCSITATFQNDKLTGKSQFGLK